MEAKFRIVYGSSYSKEQPRTEEQLLTTNTVMGTFDMVWGTFDIVQGTFDREYDRG
jgi:hypothetical protein